jgi:hypothetical protein
MTTTQKELLDRFAVIEHMIQEGRQTTESWGWLPLLWGTGQILAMFWSMHSSQPPIFPWLIAMSACAVLSGFIFWLRRRQQPARTTVGRALSAVWVGTTVSMFMLGFVGGFTSALSYRAILAVLVCLQGTGNFASGVILRWRLQTAVALLWWVAVPFMMLAPLPWTYWVFIVVTAIGEVLFGLYLMVVERRRRALA